MSSCAVADPQPLWKPGRWLEATGHGAREAGGLVSAGLGFYKRHHYRARRPKKDGTRTERTTYGVDHIGSGHCVCLITAPHDEALALATELRDLGDWGFTGLFGWQNSEPDLMERYVVWMESKGRLVTRLAGAACEQTAIAIAATL